MADFQITSMHTGVPTHYCPGCSHGIIERLIMESIEELGVAERTIAIPGVGCAGLAVAYYNCDCHGPSHGRALAVATGIKRVLPDRIVFTYQGDGDLASIGMMETIHAANRGERLTTILANNAIYGMTGGQASPTTLLGQISTTSRKGRNVADHGHPIHVCELLSQLDGAHYIERVSLDSVKNIRNAKRAIKKAFQNQIDGKGFSLVEVLSTCPTNWGMTPVAAMEWVGEHMSKEYPLGVYKHKDQKAEGSI